MAFDPASPNYPSQAGEAAMNAIKENFLQLRKKESGGTQPANAVAGMFWHDTGNGLMKQRNQANNAWITLWELDKDYPSFPSGTKMIFFQAAAPTGWTKDTTYNGYMPHIVTDGTGGDTGGSADPVASHMHTTPPHTLLLSEIPPHAHNVGSPSNLQFIGSPSNVPGNASVSSGSAGGGGSHAHGNTGTLAAPKFYNGIICSKD
ncbi:MAG: hypothetical protein V3U75_12890 [Methylococcaceae bacterium]